MSGQKRLTVFGPGGILALSLLLLTPVVVAAEERDGMMCETKGADEASAAAPDEMEIGDTSYSRDVFAVEASRGQAQRFESVSAGVVLASVCNPSCVSSCDLCLDLCSEQAWQCRLSCGNSFMCYWQYCEPQLRACENNCYAPGGDCGLPLATSI